MPPGPGGAGTPRHVGQRLSGARSAPGTPRAGARGGSDRTHVKSDHRSGTLPSASQLAPAPVPATATVFTELERYLQEQEVEAKKVADVGMLQEVLQRVLANVKELAEEVQAGAAKSASEHQKALVLLQKAKAENEALKKRSATIEQFFEKKVEQYNHLLQEERRAVKELKAKNDHLSQAVESCQGQGAAPNPEGVHVHGRDDAVAVLTRQLKYEREQRLACEEQGSKMQAEQGKTISNLEHRIKLLTQQHAGGGNRRSVSPNNNAPRFGGRTSSTSGMSGFSGNSGGSHGCPSQPNAAHAAAMGLNVGANLPGNLPSSLRDAAAAAFSHVPPAAQARGARGSAERPAHVGGVGVAHVQDGDVPVPPPVLDDKLLGVGVGAAFPSLTLPSSTHKSPSARDKSGSAASAASGQSAGLASPPPTYPVLPTPLPDYRAARGSGMGATVASAVAVPADSSLSLTGQGKAAPCPPPAPATFASGTGAGPVPSLPKLLLRSISPPVEHPPTPLLPISPPTMLPFDETSPPQPFAIRTEPATATPTPAAPDVFAGRQSTTPQPPPPFARNETGLDMLERKMMSGGTIDSIDELSSVLQALETTVLKP